MNKIAIFVSLLAAGGTIYYMASDVLGSASESDGSRSKSVESQARENRIQSKSRKPDDAQHNQQYSKVADASIEERVAHLERELLALRKSSALKSGVALSGGGFPRSIADSPEMEAEVRSICQREREREREHELETRRDRLEEMQDATLGHLAERAGLNENQRERIDSLWTSEMDQVLPLVESMRRGDRDFEELRDEMKRVRLATDDAARVLLTTAQMESYDEIRPAA